MPTKRECLSCGKLTSNYKYCSRECYTNAITTRERRICKICRQTFAVDMDKKKSNTPYCSQKCRNVGSATRGYRLTCQNEKCGKYFYVSKSRIPHRKHCSRACANEIRKKYRTFKCYYCKNTITTEKWRKNMFCSKRCAKMHTRRTKVCKHCKKHFWFPSGRRRVYCSDKCRKNASRAKLPHCLWCNDVIRNRSAKMYCSVECKWMNIWYKNQNLQSITFPQIFVYKDENSEPIWLPVTSDEIEITLYLYRLGLQTNDVIKHVKRWRLARRKYKDVRKNRDE